MAVGLIGLAVGCGGTPEPAQSPATVVHVDTVEQPPAGSSDHEEVTAPPAVAPMEDLVEQHCAQMTRQEPVRGSSHQDAPFEHALTLMPGRCYTIVALADDGAPLELSMIADMPGMPMELPVLAQGRSEGDAAVLGGAADCFKNPLPLPMQVKVVAGSQRATSVEAVICSR